ncbi:hypothetical protein SME36J_46690 [Serratia marcescens]|nr:hypothetical protein SME36J_46690 [Serratia marcescens]
MVYQASLVVLSVMLLRRYLLWLLELQLEPWGEL